MGNLEFYADLILCFFNAKMLFFNNSKIFLLKVNKGVVKNLWE